MIRLILILFLTVSGVCCSAAESENAIDQRILVACATDPDAGTYRYVHKHFSGDPAVQGVIADPSPDKITGWIGKNRLGLAIAGVGSLVSAGKLDDAQIRRFSLMILGRMDRKDVFFGKAKPAFAWLQIEDKHDMTAEQFTGVAPLLTDPLVALSVYRNLPDATVAALVKEDSFATLASVTQASILEMAISRKIVTADDPATETRLQQAAKGSADGKIAWFTYTRRRDPAIVGEYARFIEGLAKAKDDTNLMVLLSQTADLRTKLDIQNLAVGEKTKVRILKLNAGGDDLPEGEDGK